MNRPYIGVTGAVVKDDVISACRLFNARPGGQRSGRRLMLGVLVSAKTLDGRTVPSRRYPTIKVAEELLAEAASHGAWPVVHFNSNQAVFLDEQLNAVLSACPSARGIQLNIVRPDVAALERFRESYPDIEIIVQANKSSLRTNDPVAVRGFAATYRHVADHCLIDMSGGTGRVILPEWTAAAIGDADWWIHCGITPGIAGGLGPDALPVLTDVLGRFGRDMVDMLSVDAETGLRVSVDDPLPGEKHQDRMDAARVGAYYTACDAAFA